MATTEQFLGESLQVLNEGLTPYLKTSCKIYGITWPALDGQNLAREGWNPGELVASLEMVVQCWDQVFQNTLDAGFLHVIPQLCAAIDGWVLGSAVTVPGGSSTNRCSRSTQLRS